MVIVSQYDVSFNEKKVFFIKSSEKCSCPVCDGALISRDSRLRKVIRKSGEVIRIRVRRLKCTVCEKLHTELPDFIHPFKQYESAAVQSALDGNHDDCPAEDSTIRRWRTEFQQQTEQINGILTALWMQSSGRHWYVLSAFSLLDTIIQSQKDWLSFVNRTLLNSGYAAYTQSAFCPEYGCATLSSPSKRKGQPP
jgi:hypothetical protein